MREIKISLRGDLSKMRQPFPKWRVTIWFHRPLCSKIKNLYRESLQKISLHILVQVIFLITIGPSGPQPGHFVWGARFPSTIHNFRLPAPPAGYGPVHHEQLYVIFRKNSLHRAVQELNTQRGWKAHIFSASPLTNKKNNCNVSHHIEKIQTPTQ